MIKSTSVIAASVALLIMVAPAVMAQSLDLQVSTGQQPSNRISSCPDSVLTDISADVTNLGSQTDTISMTLDWPADLGFIKPFVTLASGESARVKPFWITLPYNLDPGIYYAKVTAESAMTGDKVTKDIEIEILKCYSVDVSVEDDTQRSCRETQEPVTYDIKVANDGKWDETYDLTASVDWATFSDDSVTVDSGESFLVSMVLEPPASLSPGKHTVFVTARSTDSYADDTASVDMLIDDCFGFSAELTPESQTTCLGEGKDYELKITNSGETEDEFLVSGPGWVFLDKDSLVVGAGDTGTVSVTALPDKLGIQTFEVVVRSVRDTSSDPITLAGVINADECRGVAVIISPSNVDVCKGEDALFTVSVKNTGSLEGTFGISSTFGELDGESVDLDGGQSKSVGLKVDTADLPEGDVVISVTAKEGSVQDTASAEVKAEECFASELTLQPDDVTVCPGATIPYTIRIKNTGIEADTYNLRFADEDVDISLEPGKSEAVSYDFTIPYVDEGRYKFTVEMTSSSGASMSRSSDITMKSSGSCYGVVLEDDSGTVEVGKATTVEVLIRNTGEQSDTFTISITDGPDWVFIEPSEVHLGGSEESTVYLYMSPGFGVKLGDYKVSLKAKSKNAETTLDVNAIVPEDISAQPPAKPPTANGSGGNVSINVTIPPSTEDNTSGDGSPITGGAIEDRPFWKTAAVALIALVIVAILVLRFVLLLKK